jgi:hypothetical protein
MMKKSTRLTTSCAILFATFPALYYTGIVLRDPVTALLALGLLSAGVALALTT